MAQAAERDGVPILPTDHDLRAALGLSEYYERVYRSGSRVIHYSFGSALDGFAEWPRTGGTARVVLNRPQYEHAEEALTLAVIVYSQFLELSEPIVRHGVTPIARRELVGYLNERALAEAPEPDK